MARLRLRQIPKRSFKKRAVPAAVRFKQDPVYVAKINAQLSSIGPDYNRGKNTMRKIMMQDIATSIVNDTRTIHINETLRIWKDLRSVGQLDGKVALLVDGSPNRPITNVKVFGRIDVVAQASVELMIEAAAFAWYTIITHAKAAPGARKASIQDKGHSARYDSSFEMYISQKTQVKSLKELESKMEPDDWVDIHNHVPYASYLERYRYPVGSFWYTYKKLRQKYGALLAIRFDYVESTDYKMKTQGGIPSAQPVLRIGQLSAFPSRAAPIKKIKRDASKRGRR